MMNALLFWLILLLVFMGAYAMGSRRAAARARAAASQTPPASPPEAVATLESKLAPWLRITGRKAFGNVVQFEGHLRVKAEEVFGKIREAFAGQPVTPLLTPAANDLTPVGPPRRALGYFTFLIIMAVPHLLFEAIGVHCPYL